MNCRWGTFFVFLYHLWCTKHKHQWSYVQNCWKMNVAAKCRRRKLKEKSYNCRYCYDSNSTDPKILRFNQELKTIAPSLCLIPIATGYGNDSSLLPKGLPSAEYVQSSYGNPELNKTKAIYWRNFNWESVTRLILLNIGFDFHL